MNAFDELMAIRNLGEPAQNVTVTGKDPVLSTRFKLGETAGHVLAALGVAVSDIWEGRSGRVQDVEIDVSHAAAALRSYQYMSVDDPAYQAAVAARRGKLAAEVHAELKDEFGDDNVPGLRTVQNMMDENRRLDDTESWAMAEATPDEISALAPV